MVETSLWQTTYYTIQAVKSKRDKCLIRAGHIQHFREIVHRLTNHTSYTDAVNDAIAADYYMYFSEGRQCISLC